METCTRWPWDLDLDLDLKGHEWRSVVIREFCAPFLCRVLSSKAFPFERYDTDWPCDFDLWPFIPKSISLRVYTKVIPYTNMLAGLLALCWFNKWKIKHFGIIRLSIKPGFHYPSWRSELTARVDGWPVTGFHYPSTRAVLTVARFHLPSWRATRLVETRARQPVTRQLGPSTRVVETALYAANKQTNRQCRTSFTLRLT